jgi:hypothetical protein
MTFLAVLAVTSLSWTAAASAAKVHKEIRYARMVVESGFYVDNDPSGQSGGDLYGSTGRLTHNGGRVGTFSSTCTAASANQGQCSATLVWSSGDRLQLAGELDMQEAKNRLSIVGGTGKYKQARGDAVLTRLNDQGTVQRIRLRILR